MKYTKILGFSVFNATAVGALFVIASLNISSAIADEVLQTGFVDLIYDEASDSVFVQLDKSQLDQEFIFQSSLPRGIGSNDIGLDRGQLGDTRLAKFTRFGNKIFLQQLNTEYRASSSNAAERLSIDEAFADSVIAGFVIDSEEEDSLRFNYTDFLISDIHGIADRLSSRSQGAYSVDKGRSGVFMPRTKAFPENTELEALVTFSGSPKGRFIRDVSPDAKSVTVHLHHSFVQLPDDDYEPRAFHPFSGFWKHSFQDYSAAISQDMEVKYIPRHRLEKKDATTWLSEPVEPIVYYLDPGIPEPIMTALKEGALWWDQAFASAGYVNAFQVKVLPEDADPMDVRYNVIQWVHRATRGWSYGSSVVDPRTGEIIKGHVTLGSLRVRQDYLIALGLTSPFTEDAEQGEGEADTSVQLELALNRIRQLSAHEVGHTLGIAHNFAASENDRASVMDYPHPYVTLKFGKLDLSDAYDLGIGEWDKYVVEYGYQDFDDSFDENEALLGLVEKAKEKGFLYKSDPDARTPARASADGHLWDNGADPIDEFKRISDLRAFALSNFGLNSLPKNTPLSSLEERLVPIYYAHRFQLDALVKQISGLEYEYSVKSSGTPLENVVPVSPQIQHEALELMLKSASAEYLILPESLLSLIPPKAYGSNRNRESMGSRMGIAFDPITAAESAAAYSLGILLRPERLNRISYQHMLNENIPSVQDIVRGVFDKLVSFNLYEQDGWSIAYILEARLRYVALNALFDALSSETLSPEAQIAIQSEILAYGTTLETIVAPSREVQVLQKHLAHYWEHGNWPMKMKIVPLPPGSPI